MCSKDREWGREGSLYMIFSQFFVYHFLPVISSFFIFQWKDHCGQEKETLIVCLSFQTSHSRSIIRIPSLRACHTLTVIDRRDWLYWESHLGKTHNNRQGPSVFRAFTDSIFLFVDSPMFSFINTYTREYPVPLFSSFWWLRPPLVKQTLTLIQLFLSAGHSHFYGVKKKLPSLSVFESFRRLTRRRQRERERQSWLFKQTTQAHTHSKESAGLQRNSDFLKGERTEGKRKFPPDGMCCVCLCVHTSWWRRRRW